jgi:predicted amidohydrolase
MKVALAQICSSDDPWENLFLVQSLTLEAAEKGAGLVCFPENVFFRGPKSKLTSDFVLSLSGNRLIESSDFSKAVGEWFRSLPCAVSLGSVPERSDDPAKPYNSHWFVDLEGRVQSYHKIHLFDFVGSQAVYKESDEMSRGKDLVSVDFEGFHLGLSICFDLRFAELFRKLVLQHRANVLLVPAAFTRETGRAHWHTLLRARAIENLSYVIGIGQWGSHQNEKGQELWCYGNSVVYAPWGEQLVVADEEGSALLFVDLELQRLSEAREKLPALDLAVLAKGDS